jgi:hypothetical protein
LKLKKSICAHSSLFTPNIAANSKYTSTTSRSHLSYEEVEASQEEAEDAKYEEQAHARDDPGVQPQTPPPQEAETIPTQDPAAQADASVQHIFDHPAIGAAIFAEHYVKEANGRINLPRIDSLMPLERSHYRALCVHVDKVRRAEERFKKSDGTYYTFHELMDASTSPIPENGQEPWILSLQKTAVIFKGQNG